MKINIIEIGNSQGIRLPKALIEQCGFKGSVEAKIENGKLILSPSQEPRAGWAEAFQAMAKNEDDKLVYPEISSLNSDNDDWEWEW